MLKRRISKNKRSKFLDKIKNSKPFIIFKASNITITLKNKDQLKRWLDRYPEGTYTINDFNAFIE